MTYGEAKTCLSLTASIGFPALTLLFVVTLGLETYIQSSFLVKLLPQAALYGLIAFTIAMFAASWSGRRIVRGDILRIVCWTVVGAAEGFREMGMGYYALGSPKYVAPVNMCTIGVMVACLGVIIVSRLMCPPAPESAVELDGPRCDRCGYSLRGVESARCPECGVPFEDSQPRNGSNAG